MVLVEVDRHVQKDQTRPLSYTIHKNKHKTDKGPECERQDTRNTQEEKAGKNSLTSAKAISYLTHIQRLGNEKQKLIIGTSSR